MAKQISAKSLVIIIALCLQFSSSSSDTVTDFATSAPRTTDEDNLIADDVTTSAPSTAQYNSDTNNTVDNDLSSSILPAEILNNLTDYFQNRTILPDVYQNLTQDLLQNVSLNGDSSVNETGPSGLWFGDIGNTYLDLVGKSLKEAHANSSTAHLTPDSLQDQVMALLDGFLNKEKSGEEEEEQEVDSGEVIVSGDEELDLGTNKTPVENEHDENDPDTLTDEEKKEEEPEVDTDKPTNDPSKLDAVKVEPSSPANKNQPLMIDSQRLAKSSMNSHIEGNNAPSSQVIGLKTIGIRIIWPILAGALLIISVVVLLIIRHFRKKKHRRDVEEMTSMPTINVNGALPRPSSGKLAEETTSFLDESRSASRLSDHRTPIVRNSSSQSMRSASAGSEPDVTVPLNENTSVV